MGKCHLPPKGFSEGVFPSVNAKLSNFLTTQHSHNWWFFTLNSFDILNQSLSISPQNIFQPFFTVHMFNQFVVLKRHQHSWTISKHSAQRNIMQQFSWEVGEYDTLEFFGVDNCRGLGQMACGELRKIPWYDCRRKEMECREQFAVVCCFPNLVIPRKQISQLKLEVSTTYGTEDGYNTSARRQFAVCEFIYFFCF